MVVDINSQANCIEDEAQKMDKKGTVENQGRGLRKRAAENDVDLNEMKQKKEQHKGVKEVIKTRPHGRRKVDYGGKESNKTKDEEAQDSKLSEGKGQHQSDNKLQPKNTTCDYKPKEGNIAPTEDKKGDKIESQTVHRSCNIIAIFSNFISKYKLVLAFIVVLPVVIASLALYLWNDTNIISKNKAAHMENFNTALNKMENDFPGQTERFWKILRNRGNAYLKKPSPKRPLVIMVAASPSAHNVLDCMARKIAYSLEREDDVTNIINGADFKTYSDLDDAKKSLDENLNQHLQKSRTLIVLNLDLVPPQSPLLFYEYCDNENAPYKQALIVFTIRLKVEPSPNLTPTKAEGLVEKHLKEIWRNHSYRPDDINPLVSRVTDTIVLVNQESEEVINTHCAA